MKKNLFVKILVIGVIFLFAGAGVIPSMSVQINEINDLYNIESESNNEVAQSIVDGYSSKDEIDWWPMFRHDPGNTGCSTSSAPNNDDVLWKTETGNTFDLSSPAVVNQRLYIGTLWSSYYEKSYPLPVIKKHCVIEKPFLPFNRINLKSGSMQDFNGSLLCFDTVFGKEIWEFPVEGYIDASPAVADGRAYITSIYSDDDVSIGRIYCVDAETGVEIWQETIDSYVSSPIEADGKVYILSMDNDYNTNLRCFNAATGDVLWENSYTNEYTSIFPPSVDNGKVYFATSDYVGYEGRVHCVDAENGDFIWDSLVAGVSEFYSTVVAEEMVFIPAFDYMSENGYLYCFNAQTGSQLWNFSLGYWCLLLFSLPAVCNDRAYIIPVNFYFYESMVYCVDISSGNEIWKVPISDWVFASPAVADGKIFFVTEGGWMFCLNVTDGSSLWNYALDDSSDSSPSIADNKLYSVTMSGTIYAFGPLGNPPTSPIIDGPSKGPAGTELCWTFHSDDVDGDIVKYIIYWGDGTPPVVTDYYPSCTPVEVCHTYEEQEEYTITATAEDVKGLVSEESSFKVTIPRVKTVVYHPLLLRLFKQFPNAFQILKYILGVQ